MNISGERILKVPQKIAWDVLMDPNCLRKSFPGVKEFNPTGENTWDAKVEMGVASIKGSYAVKIYIEDVREPEHYFLGMSGQGGPGWVKGGGGFDLEDVDNSTKTKVTYSLEAQVGGLIAGVGQRLLGGVAKMVFGQFFDNMEKMMLAKMH